LSISCSSAPPEATRSVDTIALKFRRRVSDDAILAASTTTLR